MDVPHTSVYWKPKYSGNDLVRRSLHLLFLFFRFSQKLPLGIPLGAQYIAGTPKRFGAKGMVRLSVTVALDGKRVSRFIPRIQCQEAESGVTSQPP